MSAHSLVSSTSTRMHIVALHVSVLYCGMYVPGIATCLYLELGCDCSVLHVHTVIVVNKKGYIGMPWNKR